MNTLCQPFDALFARDVNMLAEGLDPSPLPSGSTSLEPFAPSLDARKRLDEALARLSGALGQLEGAWERRAALDAERGDLIEELAVMQDDRARLAAELDGALARGQALEAAQIQVARRLARAGEAIRAVISSAEAGDE